MQVMSMFMAMCEETEDQGNCMMDDYRNWCYEEEQCKTVLSQTDMS